jgi:hypothetical protein
MSFTIRTREFPFVWRCVGFTKSFTMRTREFPFVWRCAGFTNTAFVSSPFRLTKSFTIRTRATPCLAAAFTRQFVVFVFVSAISCGICSISIPLSVRFCCISANAICPAPRSGTHFVCIGSLLNIL